jgi:hypothetical protein
MMTTKTAAGPTGKTQKAIMDYLGHGATVELSDMARHPSFRGIHFGDIMSAAEALQKKGLIDYKRSVGSSTLTKKASDPAAAFAQVLSAERVASRFVSAGIWNSSWHKVFVFSNGFAHEVTVRRQVSPTGLTDDTSDRICKDLKADTIKGINELLTKMKLKPKSIDPDAHVFLEGLGTEVLYSFMVGIYAKDDKQSAEIGEALRLHGAKGR